MSIASFDSISGVSIDSLDKQGNSPLHYASKHGNPDICKYLVEQGASVVQRNNKQQTPYDVAENHVVRQFLLPLQLKSERSNGDVPADVNSFQHMLYGGSSATTGGINYTGPGAVAGVAAGAADAGVGVSSSSTGIGGGGGGGIGGIAPPPYAATHHAAGGASPTATAPLVGAVPSDAGPGSATAGLAGPPPGAVPSYGYNPAAVNRPANSRLIQPGKLLYRSTEFSSDSPATSHSPNLLL